jgi:hypothetical protein
VTRFWFFGSGGTVFISTAECGGLKAAKLLALDYNRQPGPLGAIDLIVDAQDPARSSWWSTRGG